MTETVQPSIAYSLSRFKPYPTYKDSGVEWLGKIPTHWEVKRLKYVARVNMGQSPDSGECNQNGDGTPFLQGNAEFGNLYPTPKLFCQAARKRAMPGDILLSVRAPVGALNVADQEYGIGRGLCAIRPHEEQLLSGYGQYLLDVVRLELDIVATGSTYEAVAVDQVGSIRCLLPSNHEQKAIAAFLDRETAKLDALVAKKERLIELLQEKRSALITQAVTEGLDPNVPMKDSGAEWLGEIPAHWEVKRIKHLKSKEKNAFVDGPFGSNLKTEHYADDGEVLVIESEFATRGRLVLEGLKRIRWQHFETIKRSETKAGDIIIAKIGAYFGMSDILPDLPAPAVVSGNSMKLTVDSKQSDVGFVRYHLLQLKWAGAIDLLAGTTAQPALSLQGMNTLALALPPLSEQRTITAFLDRETAKFDALIAKVREGIEKLKEYRTALISAAVTGKIDVRDAAVAG